MYVFYEIPGYFKVLESTCKLEGVFTGFLEVWEHCYHMTSNTAAPYLLVYKGVYKPKQIEDRTQCSKPLLETITL